MAGLVNLVDLQIDDLNYQSATLHFGYLLRRNVRAVAEGTYIFQVPIHTQKPVRFVSAF